MPLRAYREAKVSKEPKVYKAYKGSMGRTPLKAYQEVKVRKAPKVCKVYKAHPIKEFKDPQAPRVQDHQGDLTHKYSITTGVFLEEYPYYYTTMLQEY